MVESDDGQLEMAVAAAAFVIASMDREDPPIREISTVGSSSPSTTMMSRSEDQARTPLDSTNKEDGEIEGIDNVSWRRYKIPETKKASTFVDKYPNDAISERFMSGIELIGPTAPSTTKKHRDKFTSKNGGKKLTKSSEVEETYAWKKDEIVRVNNRYDKTNAEILKWENEMKAKAKSQMVQKERGVEERHARFLEEYRTDVSWIDKIAIRARASAEEEKRDSESKARKMRSEAKATAKPTRSCFCF